MRLLHKTLAVGLFAAMLGGSLSAFAAEGADKKEEKAVPKDIVLKGDAKCTQCHDEADSPAQLAIGKTKHGVTADKRNPTCTSCHGESEKHIKEAGRAGVKKGESPVDIGFTKNAKTSIEARNQSCLNCHQGGPRIHWQSGVHANRDVACSNCHSIHTPHDKVRDKVAQSEVCFACHKEQRAQVNRPSHHPIVEGKMACSNCHNVHGDNPKQMVRGTVNETCYTCHMEKRGPFVHNHQPVTEDCSICHNPHGTTAANLLKSRSPLLCQQCHSHTSHPSQATGLPTSPTSSTSLIGSVGRGCLNCHTNIHGSNSTQNAATVGRFRR